MWFCDFSVFLSHLHLYYFCLADSAFVAGSVEMCNLKDEFKELHTVRKCKRKLFSCDFGEIHNPPKRISPFLNTPKEKKEERRRILKVSIKKLKEIENAELYLRRSLLIHNTVRRLQNEMQLDKRTKAARMGCRCNISTHYMKESLMYDDPVINDVNENISDDMTDTLMKNLEEKIGGRLVDDCVVSPRICVTPSPAIYENTADPRTCVTSVPVERNDQIYTPLVYDNDESVKSVINSEKCFESDDNCSIFVARNSKRSHFEYKMIQTSIETCNADTEIDKFADDIPIGLMMDTNRPILSNKFISLSTDNSGDTDTTREKDLNINLPYSLPIYPEL